MKLNLVKTRAGLIPATDDDMAALATLEQGEVYSFSVRLFRNYEFHKKLFAMLELCFENQDQYKNTEHFRKVMTMKAGYFDEVATDKGIVFLPKSIAFDKMDNFEFQQLYDKVLDQCIAIVPINKEDIISQLAGFG